MQKCCRSRKLHRQSGAFADEEEIGQMTQAANEGTKNISDGFIMLPGGIFSMGSPDSERQRQEDETLHDVTVSAFYMDPYEVTQKDYLEIMGENPSHFRGDALPVENVTWYDAVSYCNKLSENKGLTPVYEMNALGK